MLCQGKWTAFKSNSALLDLLTTQSALRCKPHAPTQTQACNTFNWAIQCFSCNRHTDKHTDMHTHQWMHVWERFGIRPEDTSPTEAAGDQTTDFPISVWPALSTEAQLPQKNTFCSFDSHCTKTYLLLLLKMKKTTFSPSSMTFSFLLTTDTERGLGRRVISGEKHDADGH